MFNIIWRFRTTVLQGKVFEAHFSVTAQQGWYPGHNFKDPRILKCNFAKFKVSSCGEKKQNYNGWMEGGGVKCGKRGCQEYHYLPTSTQYNFWHVNIIHTSLHSYINSYIIFRSESSSRSRKIEVLSKKFQTCRISLECLISGIYLL